MIGGVMGRKNASIVVTDIVATLAIVGFMMVFIGVGGKYVEGAVEDVRMTTVFEISANSIVLLLILLQ
jgi:hypothetical protein